MVTFLIKINVVQIIGLEPMEFLLFTTDMIDPVVINSITPAYINLNGLNGKSNKAPEIPSLTFLIFLNVRHQA